MATPVKAIALGLATANPWIAEYIARTALERPNWDSGKGKVRLGRVNSLVATLLSDPQFMKRLQAPLDGDYSILAVSVEKVLVGRLNEIVPQAAPGHLRVPFDAQLWFVVEKRR